MGIAERREREKEQRQKDIVDAAERIFFSRGFNNATMDEVAEEAELSKGTLYLYFQNKIDLYHAIVCRGMDVLFDLFDKASAGLKTGLEKIEAIGRAYLVFFRQHPNYFNALLHQEIQQIEEQDIQNNPYILQCQEKGNRIFGLIQDAVRQGMEDRTIRPDVDPVMVSLILWGHSTGILQIMKSKGEMLEKLMGIRTDDTIAYAFGLMKAYLQNGRRAEEKKK
jgi:TetR/AcrR family transcriptional regulator